MAKKYKLDEILQQNQQLREQNDLLRQQNELMRQEIDVRDNSASQTVKELSEHDDNGNS